MTPNNTTQSTSRVSCRNHPLREAAARCVGCGQRFCRECVTPVERRMFCAECFKVTTDKPKTKPRNWFMLSISTQLLVGIIFLWFMAYVMGRILLAMPVGLHEGTAWEKVGD